MDRRLPLDSGKCWPLFIGEGKTSLQENDCCVNGHKNKHMCILPECFVAHERYQPSSRNLLRQ